MLCLSLFASLSFLGAPSVVRQHVFLDAEKNPTFKSVCKKYVRKTTLRPGERRVQTKMWNRHVWSDYHSFWLRKRFFQVVVAIRAQVILQRRHFEGVYSEYLADKTLGNSLMPLCSLCIFALFPKLLKQLFCLQKQITYRFLDESLADLTDSVMTLCEPL